MGIDAIIVLAVIILAVILFATEWLSIDLTAILIMVVLVISGVITPAEGIGGFSNPAVITVAFMFVLSYALLKTGSLQRVGPLLGALFKSNFQLGMLVFMIFIGLVSAFVNNTPVVAMFIPVMVSVANAAKVSPSKLLIPLSYASIFGGTCTLIGTSTNVLVSGIAETYGLEGFHMFLSTPVGVILLIAGSAYIYFFGRKLLPDRDIDEDLEARFRMRDYVTDLKVLEGSEFVGQRIMDSVIVSELELDIIEVRRKDSHFTLPPGDFVIKSGDVLKVRCNVEKIKELKDRIKIGFNSSAVRLGDGEIQSGDTTILELIITAGSEFEGKSLRQMDFRQRYRGVPLAILHREEVVHDHLHDVELQAGDIILAEVRTHRVENLKRMEMAQQSPFIVLSEEGIIDFNKKKFAVVLSVIMAVVVLASLEWLPIVIGAVAGSCALVVTRVLTMKELYRSIEWKIVFLLAGSLSLGLGMENSGLVDVLAALFVDNLNIWGPVAVLSGMYLATSILTEIMSNNAIAALMAPIAISTAKVLGLSPIPFLMAVMLAASASFMTPIGYQTNTMVYSAGRYKFFDFFRVGVGLNILFWILCTLLIPVFYKF